MSKFGKKIKELAESTRKAGRFLMISELLRKSSKNWMEAAVFGLILTLILYPYFGFKFCSELAIIFGSFILVSWILKLGQYIATKIKNKKFNDFARHADELIELANEGEDEEES